VHLHEAQAAFRSKVHEQLVRARILKRLANIKLQYLSFFLDIIAYDGLEGWAIHS
jgi:hypothetical protein